MNSRSDTIAAICTPSGIGGIGIIRVSGSRTLEIIRNIANTPYNIPSLNTLNTRKLIHAYILDADGNKIDEVLLACMPPYKSYSGEWTIEVHCHGGRAVLTLILDRILSSGARIAKPGEFTRRAFENGRINLIQAEAINEIIMARTGLAVKSAWRQYDGGLNSTCKNLREQLKEIKTWIQNSIEFGIVSEEKSNILRIAEQSQEALNELLMQQDINTFTSSAVWMTFVGPANSGKSSIFNKILRSERSIVSDIPGTTTDFISETIDLDGKEVRITDTAGFKKPIDSIQIKSIERSLEQQKAADIVLYVVDQSQDITEYMSEIKSVLTSGGILLLNKCDLSTHESVGKLINSIQGQYIFTSVILNQGIEELLNKIAEKVNIQSGENVVTLTKRQRSLLLVAVNELKIFLDVFRMDKIDILLFHIDEAISSLSEITGDINNDEVFDAIFSRFCIGK